MGAYGKALLILFVFMLTLPGCCSSNRNTVTGKDLQKDPGSVQTGKDIQGDPGGFLIDKDAQEGLGNSQVEKGIQEDSGEPEMDEDIREFLDKYQIDMEEYELLKKTEPNLETYPETAIINMIDAMRRYRHINAVKFVTVLEQVSEDTWLVLEEAIGEEYLMKLDFNLDLINGIRIGDAMSIHAIQKGNVLVVPEHDYINN